MGVVATLAKKQSRPLQVQYLRVVKQEVIVLESRKILILDCLRMPSFHMHKGWTYCYIVFRSQVSLKHSFLAHSGGRTGFLYLHTSSLHRQVDLAVSARF